MGVDIVPCLAIDEGELVGCYADHMTVLVVKLFGDVGQVAFGEGDDIGDSGNGPQRRSGVF